MADDIFDETDDDFEDDMSDILDDPLEDDPLEDEPQAEASDEIEEDDKKEKQSILSRLSPIISKAKELLKKMVGSTRSIIILSVSVVLFLIVVLVLWMFVFRSDPEIPGPQSETGQEQLQGESEPEEILFEDIVELAPFEQLSLKTSSTMGKVNMTISLELIDPKNRKQIFTMEERIRTIVSGQVENTTWLELRNPDGKLMLKYNLLQRINALFPRPTVRNLYFTYFIMQ